MTTVTVGKELLEFFIKNARGIETEKMNLLRLAVETDSNETLANALTEIEQLKRKTARQCESIKRYQDEGQGSFLEMDMLRARVIELETQQAASVGGEQETPEVVGYLRDWAYCKEVPTKQKNENGRLAWPFKFKLMPITQTQCLRDDQPLMTVTQHERIVAALSPAGAVRDIMSERQRQVSEEGYDVRNDDMATNGEMAVAAGHYSLVCGWPHERDTALRTGHRAPEYWPWADEFWKPTTPRRNLVKAGALIVAEIERLDRLEKDQK